MPSVYRYVDRLFWPLFLILAIGCFYFSISQALFAWFFPDELAATSSYKAYGLIKCSGYYYFKTTINRISAATAICSMAKAATWFSPYIGWMLARLSLYTLIPLSLSFALQQILKIPFKYGIGIAFIISSIGMFILSDDIYYMFGLDLAIYATATATFFILIGLLPRGVQSFPAFLSFCVLYAVNLNTHELFLVISGFFIPIFAWYRFSLVQPNNRITLGAFFLKVFADKYVRTLVAIYLISACFTMLAPGVAIRQKVWPSSGTFSQGLQYMLLAVSEMIYLIVRAYVLVAIVFLIGIISRLCTVTETPSKFKWLYAYLFIAPFLYLVSTGYLIGITPSLWVGSAAPMYVKSLFVFLQDDILVKHGGLATRQEVFLYIGIFFDVFILGFLISPFVIKLINTAFVKNTMILKMSLISLVTFLFVLHPDAYGSLKILKTLTKRAELTPDTYLALVDKQYLSHFSSMAFKRNKIVKHDAAVLSVMVNKYFKNSRSSTVSCTLNDKMYKSLIPAYRISSNEPWQSQILSMYNVRVEESCYAFSSEA